MKSSVVFMLLLVVGVMALHVHHQILCVVGNDTKECKVRRSSLTTAQLIPICTATKTEAGKMARRCLANLDESNIKSMNCGKKCVLKKGHSFCCCTESMCNSDDRLEMN